MPQFGTKYDVISEKKKSSPKFQEFFRPKTSDLQEKGLHRNLRVFSSQNQVISKKRKK